MSTPHETPIGTLHLAASYVGLTLCGFRPHSSSGTGAATDATPRSAVLDHARRELDAYFAGTLWEFTVPVDLSGVGEYERRVLERLREVSYGETTTYGALAAAVTSDRDGLPVGEARRVGGVMAGNPVAVVVPCHRVVGSDGSLTGYAGGLETKRALLDLESRDRTPTLF